MDGLKRLLAILVMFLTASIVPVQAQFTGDPMGMGPFGQSGQQWNPYSGMQQAQSMPYGYAGTGYGQSTPYGYPGMQQWQSAQYGYPGMGYGQSMPYGYPGMGYGQSMPYGYPGTGTLVRQSDPFARITRLQPSNYRGTGVDLMASMEGMPQLSMFTAAVKATGYDEKLRREGDYLVFAPVDKSLQRDFSIRDARSLAANPGLARGIVENCIATQPGGEGNKGNMTALNGKQVNMVQLKNGITANGADVSQILHATNGMLVVTDGAVGS